jgi:ATP-dependent DNA ligase
MVFDSPNYNIIFQTGRINNPIFKKSIDQQACLMALGITEDRELRPFDFTFNDLEKNLNQNDNVKLHKQMLLPFSTESALAQLEKMLSEVTDEGAEGLILRHPAWPWEPIRSGFMCKYKLQKDAEGVIKGFIAGKGKHHGRLGSIRLSFNSLDFDVGGFTDEERELSAEGKDWAERNPGAFTFNPISSHFFLGSILTFKYRELTDRGIPKEARYLRPKMKGF